MGKKFVSSLQEIVKDYTSLEDVNLEEIRPFIMDMSKKTFCKLCKSLKTPISTYYKNVLNIDFE